ncbi:MAG: hypothetical protein ACRDCW_11600, partial [Sarcina sp.]
MSFKDIEFDKLQEIRILSDNLFIGVLSRSIAKGKRVHSANGRTKLQIIKKNTLIECDTKIASEQSFGRYNVSFAINRRDRSLYRCQCSCMDYKNNSYRNKNYMCKHIIAAIFLFFDELREKNYFEEDKRIDQRFLEIFKESRSKRE